MALASLLALASCRKTVEPVASPAKVTITQKSDPGSAISGSTAIAATTSDKSPAGQTQPSRASLRIAPENPRITADDSGLQLLVARVSGPSERDVTSSVSWSVEPAGLAAIEPGGYLRPLQAGTVTVRATVDELVTATSIHVEPRSARPWDFAADIVPILTRSGCNTGGCHGKADGQNGFHLSLYGYDPAGDFESVARADGQRRLSRIAPAESLFLTKATGVVAHGGGRRFVPGSQVHHTLLDWIEAGAPLRSGKTHGAITKVRVEPPEVRLDDPGSRQIRVIAEFADGHERDVTRQAIYRVNDDSAASVTSDGLVKLLTRAETDLIVRFQSHVVATRLSTVINPGLAFDFSRLPRQNFIDDELFKRLEALKVPASPPANDAAFLRRVSLDLTGEQPSPSEVREFLADSNPDKRNKLVDRLLARKEFVLFWRIRLGDLLQISSNRQQNGAYRYQAWIDQALDKNRPWDEVVRTLLTAVGDPNDIETGGPVNYAMDAVDPNVQAELTAQRFLGLRIRCAQCHDHPFDIWTQDDYFALAAFFAKVQRTAGGQMANKVTIKINPAGQVLHLRTKEPAQPRFLDSKETVKIDAKDDPRKSLASWMTAPENPFFARAMANWVWAQLFGKGLVDPPDDMSRANPPVHPELLDALARHFIATKYNFRDLVRTIATSSAYGLSSGTVPGNEHDTRLFSHQLPRPLTAHQMADALAQATDVPNAFQDRATRRAIQVPDPAMPSPILDTFGRCPRTATCASTPAPALSLRQALLLIGGSVVESKVSGLNGYLTSALKLELEPEELVENLYYRTVCRPPTAEELAHFGAELKKASSRTEAAEDLFWALLNSREFAFNH
jgi:hypothetical protein